MIYPTMLVVLIVILQLMKYNSDLNKTQSVNNSQPKKNLNFVLALAGDRVPIEKPPLCGGEI